MNRRRFLTHTGAVAATSLLGHVGSRSAAAAECYPPPGVQLFTVRDALQRNPRAALAALRDIGIVEGELYGLSGAESATLFGLPVSELKTLLDEHGLRVPLSHIDGALTNTADISAIARALDINTLVVSRPSELSVQRDGRLTTPTATSRGQLDLLAEKLNRVGREYREHGLHFGYHNHETEFMTADGIVPFDYLMANTDPALVKIELDIGWLAYAGQDPTAYLERYAGRVIACHLKDYDPEIASDVRARKLVEPGAGTIDFGTVLAAMRATGVAHGFVEIDVTDDPLGAVRRGHAHLQALQTCA